MRKDILKKVRILFVADCSTSSIHAQDRDAKNWALFLDSTKYDTSIFCIGEPDIRLKNKNNIHIINLNYKSKIIKILKAIFFYFFKNYDVVILSKIDSKQMGYLKPLNNLLNRRKSILPIVNQVPYVGNEKKFRAYTSSSSYIFAISSRIKKGIKKYLNIDVPVVHLCYDLAMFNPKLHYNKRKKVICISSLQARKRPFLFANIAKETPEADFIWVGDGYYMSWMEEKIRNDNITNLTMAGTLTQSKVAKLLPQCDIFLFPSIHEGFPNSVAEAMACGLACIAFDIYGPEAIIDGKTGYVVKSEFEMLKKLKFLLSNEGVLKEFSINARKRAMNFEGSNIIHELEDYIDTLAKR